MAFDEALAARLRDRVVDEPGIVEKTMFGGLVMTAGGNIAVGVFHDELLVRADPASQDVLLAEPGARQFDLVKARPMNGWIIVDAAHCADPELFDQWVSRGLAYARTLPPK